MNSSKGCGLGQDDSASIAINLGNSVDDRVTHRINKPVHFWLEQTSEGANGPWKLNRWMIPSRCSVYAWCRFGMTAITADRIRVQRKWKSAKMITRDELSEMGDNAGKHTELMRAALEGDTNTVKALLAGGAQVNAKDHEGRTALMFAVTNMHPDAAKQLLEHSADANATAADGGTALMLAASSGDTESVRALLSNGADPSARYAQTGETALILAKKNSHDDVVSLLSNDRSQTARKA